MARFIRQPASLIRAITELCISSRCFSPASRNAGPFAAGRCELRHEKREITYPIPIRFPIAGLFLVLSPSRLLERSLNFTKRSRHRTSCG